VPRSVLTASDLERTAVGGEVTIAPDTLVTPLARDEAALRNISIRIVVPPAVNSADAAGQTGSQSASQHGRVVALGADHGGYELKEQLKSHLQAWGYVVLDLGTFSTDAVDYPDFAEAVASAVARSEAWRGVVIDAAGIGSCIAANKVPGARAAVCYDRATARNSREHNDANIISFGARLIAPEVAREVLAAWLATPFAGGRHQRRIDKIRAIEDRHRQP
jgi:ribose 5-phosphate isomerase B